MIAFIYVTVVTLLHRDKVTSAIVNFFIFCIRSELAV